jgi:hypothetical protein
MIFGFKFLSTRSPNDTTYCFEPTEHMEGRRTTQIHDTRKEKDPCSFLDKFRSDSRNPMIGQHLKCFVKSKTPYLQIGENPVRMPVESASITSLEGDSKLSELEFYSGGKTYTVESSPQKIVFSEVVKQPVSTIYQYVFTASD